MKRGNSKGKSKTQKKTQKKAERRVIVIEPLRADQIEWPCALEDASRYTLTPPQTLKFHVYTVKDLKARRVGHSLIFTREQLDEFMRVRRRQGRPRRQPEPGAIPAAA